jgi:hypothetical protein
LVSFGVRTCIKATESNTTVLKQNEKNADFIYRYSMGWALAGRQVQHKSSRRWAHISAAQALVDRHPRYTKSSYRQALPGEAQVLVIHQPQVHTKALLDRHIQVHIKALISRHIQEQASIVPNS